MQSLEDESGGRNFNELLDARMKRGFTVCVGLDPDISADPERKRSKLMTLVEQGCIEAAAQLEFCKVIVDQTKHVALAFKINTAFFEAVPGGLEVIAKIIAYINEVAPEVVVILDAKRADIGNTNNGYVAMLLRLGADAVTVHPYLGQTALKPFLDMLDKGVIVLCRTSNPGAGEFQDLFCDDGSPLFLRVASNVSLSWNQNNNCLLVVGATYAKELGLVRGVVGDMPLLIPGIGAQGGDLAEVLEFGLNSSGTGVILNSSRGIIFADDPGFEAVTLHEQVRKIRGW